MFQYSLLAVTITIFSSALPLVKTLSDIIPLYVLIFTGFISSGLFGLLLELQVKVVSETRDLDKNTFFSNVRSQIIEMRRTPPRHGECQLVPEFF